MSNYEITTYNPWANFWPNGVIIAGIAVLVGFVGLTIMILYKLYLEEKNNAQRP